MLDGGAGADTMIGGAGNDAYVVDNLGDTVVEAAGGGFEDSVQSSVSFTLSDNVENLTLTGSAAIKGTGNALVNVLTANSGDCVLEGGASNDLYIVDNVGVSIIEADGGGSDDQVWSSVTFTLGNNVEILKLTGSAAINGTGNTVPNILFGNDASNILDGGADTDQMIGGAGNDTYVVDNAGDEVAEGVGGGTDLVQSSVSYTLSDEVENLTLTGNNNIDGTGNALANILTGNSGDNVLTGGAGNDIFFFDRLDSIDLVADFTPGSDVIGLSKDQAFSALPLGQLAAAQFSVGAATGTGPQIVYNQGTGALFLDTNGALAGGATQFATVAGNPTLTNADFRVM